MKNIDKLLKEAQRQLNLTDTLNPRDMGKVVQGEILLEYCELQKTRDDSKDDILTAFVNIALTWSSSKKELKQKTTKIRMAKPKQNKKEQESQLTALQQRLLQLQQKEELEETLQRQQNIAWKERE